MQPRMQSGPEAADSARDMSVKKTKKAVETSPRLGWLEAFLATAEHLNYESAGTAIGISSTKGGVDSLELWLHRLLLLSGTPLEIAPGSGMPLFQPVAVEVLEIFDACSTPEMREARAGTLRKSERSAVRLIDLQTVLTVERFPSFDSTAAQLGCSYKTARDRINVVQDALGGRLFEGRSKLSTTDLGAAFAAGAKRIIELLEGARADISDYDPEKAMIDKIHREAFARRLELRSRISLLSKSTKKIDEIVLSECFEELSRLDLGISKLKSESIISKELMKSILRIPPYYHMRVK